MQTKEENNSLFPAVPGMNWLTGYVTNSGMNKLAEKRYSQDKERLKKFFQKENR